MLAGTEHCDPSDVVKSNSWPPWRQASNYIVMTVMTIAHNMRLRDARIVEQRTLKGDIDEHVVQASIH